jgi:haloacetate dehalogenase
MMFDGFSRARVDVHGTSINVVHGGSGPPVLLLHGYPQSHVMWHRVAPMLAANHTVVCPDLRGYGDSAKPSPDDQPERYAKRTLARDQVEVMHQLGFDRFALVGHDRGARVARRLSLDHPGRVSRLAVLDIVPTHAVYANLDQARATTVWRYFFLIQPTGLPEHLIGADPVFYLHATLREWTRTPNAFTPEALAEYERCFDRATIEASCADYRAGATIDLDHDRADAARRIACPVLVLWSATGIGADYDVPEIWRQQADDVRGHPIDCGHFLAEERPDEVTSHLAAFLAVG